MTVEDGQIADETTELASRLRLTVGRLARRMRQEAEPRLSLGQHSALSTIWRFGPVTLSELSRRERVTGPAVTRIVAKLERQGLVERRTDTTDRRVNWVSTTPQGTAALEDERRRRISYLAGQLRGLGERDIETLGAAVEILDRVVQQPDDQTLGPESR